MQRNCWPLLARATNPQNSGIAVAIPSEARLARPLRKLRGEGGKTFGQTADARILRIRVQRRCCRSLHKVEAPVRFC